MRTLNKNNFLLALSRTCACLLLAVAFTVAASARNTTYQLDIPAQPLSDALQALALASQHKLLYDTALVKGKSSPALKGDFTAEEAVKRLLSGTNLSFEVTEDGLVLIRPPSAPTVSSSSRAADVQGLRLVDTSSASPGKSAERGGEEKSDVQEIIVTATKRAENVRDVPVSIAVVTAEDIERRGLVNSEDYLRGIPGANQTELGWSGQAIVIRGAETNLGYQNLGAGSTTATYFGEIPTTGSAGMLGSNVDIKLVDIQRVEVLRGPQGTSFGNSSIGGAVRVIPVAPKADRFEGKLRAGFGATSGTGGDNSMLQAVGNVPLVMDRVAVRVAAYKFSDSGFYRNRAGSDAAFQAAVVTPYGAQAYAMDEEEVGGLQSTGGRIATLFRLNDNLNLTLTYLTQKTEIDGWATATAGTYDQTLLRVAPEHVRRGQTAGVVDTNIDIANATLEYDLGWANFLATYSHINGGMVAMHPYTEAPLPWAASDGRETDFRGHVGEIRLATKLDGDWNFLAGLYGERNKNEYLLDIYWHGDPATNFFTPGGRFLQDLVDRRDMTQKAAFGEISWEFLPGLTLTGGARAFWYDRDIRIQRSGFFAGGSPPPTQDDAKDSGSNYRANLSYKMNDDTLLYAGWAQGFRLGQPQAGLPSGSCDVNSDGIVDGTTNTIDSTKRVNSDSVDSYELGSKLSLLDRRISLDVSVFRMDWSDVAVSLVAPCLFDYLTNAGVARSEGTELQANLQITDAFRVNMGGSWINARLIKDVPSAGLSAGDRLAGSPKVNANIGMEHQFDISGHAGAVRADAVYVGRLYSLVGQTTNTDAGDYVKLDVSARVTLKNLDVDLYVRNLTNENAYTMRSNFGISDQFHGYRMRPRTIGVQFGYDF